MRRRDEKDDLLILVDLVEEAPGADPVPGVWLHLDRRADNLDRRRAGFDQMQRRIFDGQLQRGARQAPYDGYLEWEYRFSPMQAVGGGANEIQRIIIAIAGLGLPR